MLLGNCKLIQIQIAHAHKVLLQLCRASCTSMARRIFMATFWSTLREAVLIVIVLTVYHQGTQEL